MTSQHLALMIPIIGSIGFFTMIIFLRRYENVERMAMIERGLNPKDMKSVWTKKDPYSPLRFGFVAVGIGLGLFLGNMIFDDEGVIAGLVFLCGGGGLLIGYLLQMQFQKRDTKDNDRESENEENL